MPSLNQSSDGYNLEFGICLFGISAEGGLAVLKELFYFWYMNRIKDFVEWNAFGVCAAIGDRMGIATSKIRQFFIYTSLITMGSPIIIYLVLAFWRNMRKYVSAARRNPWYYL